MGTSKSLSLFTLFLALSIAPQSAVALRLAPLATQVATVDAVFPLPDSVASGTTIKIASSSTLAGVNEVVEQRFENQFSGTQVDIDYTSSDEALTALDQGKVDIAAIGRPLSDAEKAQGYTEVLLGRHKIAIIVSEENPFAGGVTTVQFSQLFRGEITDWAELEGGKAGAIRFVDRPASSDTRQALSFYPVFKDVPFETGVTADPVGQDSTEALVNALGTDGMGFAIADQVINRPGIRVLSMHKVLPTNPAYPFSQPMAYVYKGDASPAVQAFLGYATAPDTAGVLDEAKTLGAEATFEGFQGAPNLDGAAVAGLVGTPSGADASGSNNAGTDANTETASNASTPSDGTSADGTTGTDGGQAGATDADPANTAPDGAANVEGSDANVDGANVDGAAAGEATVDGATADSPNSAEGNTVEDAAANNNGKFPWWLLWLIGIPVFGALLWWLLSRRTDDGDEMSPIAGVDPDTIAETDAGIPATAVAGTAVAGTAAAVGSWGAASSQQDQMVLVPRDAQSAYAYWEVSEDSLARLREDGGEEFGLRLYDVTSWDQESELPKSVHQETFDEAECDRHLTIPASNRDYVAEVGYLTPSEQWLSAARSAPVHISSDLPSFDSVTAPSVSQDPTSDESGGPNVDAVGAANALVDSAKEGVSDASNRIKGAAIAGTAAVATGVAAVTGRGERETGANVSSATAKSANRLILVPREGQNAYAYWEISEEKKAALQQKGGEKLALRLYDVTGIDPRTEKPHGVQQFDCNEQDSDLHVTVPKANRTYLADLGYTTAEGKWLRLAHAAPVQVPAQNTVSNTNSSNGHSSNGHGSNENTSNENTSNENSSRLTMGGLVDSLAEKTSDTVQASKDAVDAGQSAIANAAKSVVNTGANMGQSLVDGATQAGQSVASTGQSLATGTASTLNTVVDGTVGSTVAAGTAVATAATGVATMMPKMATQSKTEAVQIVLVARNAESAYAYWEIPTAIESELKAQQIETLSLRLHEVTNIDLEYAPAHSTQVFECSVTDRDRHVPIPTPNEDYLAELGYSQPDGTWVKLARSLHIRVG